MLTLQHFCSFKLLSITLLLPSPRVSAQDVAGVIKGHEHPRGLVLCFDSVNEPELNAVPP